MNQVCGLCGTVNTDALFCSRCGSRLPTIAAPVASDDPTTMRTPSASGGAEAAPPWSAPRPADETLIWTPSVTPGGAPPPAYPPQHVTHGVPNPAYPPQYAAYGVPMPEPGQAADKAGRPRSRRAPIMVAAAAVMALVAAGVVLFVAPGVLKNDPNPGGGASKLAVTGQPPSLLGRWSGGVKEVWRSTGAHLDPVAKAPSTRLGGPYTSTRAAWGLTDVVGDTAYVVVGIDPLSGTVLWQNMVGPCARGELGGLVPCLDAEKNAAGGYDTVLSLVDWATGTVKSSQRLDALGFSGTVSQVAAVAVVGGSIVLTLPTFAVEMPNVTEGLKNVKLIQVAADGKTKNWEADGPGCLGSSWNSHDTQHAVFHGAYSSEFGLLVDNKSGKSLLPDGMCARPVGETALYVYATSGSVPDSVTMPDGTQARAITQQSGVDIVDALPPLPLALTDVKATGAAATATRASATGVLTAVDPTTGAPAWSAGVPVPVVTWGGSPPSVGSVSSDGRRLYLRTATDLRALDAASGVQVWSVPLGDDWLRTLSRTSDGTLLTTHANGTIALDPATGAELWRVDGQVWPVPGPDGGDDLLQLGGQARADGNVARLIPANRVGQAAAVPADAPACPAGGKPVSWTQYTGGAVLVCSVGDTFAVVTQDPTGATASELDFTPGGHAVTLSNGTVVRVVLGGALVYVEKDGVVAAHPALRSWSNVSGEQKLELPADMATCPAGTWPLSVSAYSGGWVLVCGTLSRATSLAYSQGGTVHSAPSVTAAGGYCGVADGTTVCAYRSPALVTVEASGTTTQHAVATNYFDGAGQGGAGLGSGSYGVDAPKADAKDQVRYLTQLLQKAAAGRADLNRALKEVDTCSMTAQTVATVAGVGTNRSELLTALATAPVDAVPDGAALVAKLRKALQLARETDDVWLTWAQTEQANHCAYGDNSPYYAKADQMTDAVAVAKDDFLAQWNNQIAPTYGAPTFKTSQI